VKPQCGVPSISVRSIFPGAISLRYPDCPQAAPSTRRTGWLGASSRPLRAGEWLPSLPRPQPRTDRSLASPASPPASPTPPLLNGTQTAAAAIAPAALRYRAPGQTLSPAALERMRRVRSERATYLVAAIASSVGFTCLSRRRRRLPVSSNRRSAPARLRFQNDSKPPNCFFQ